MYSYEIEELIELKNHLIEIQDYIKIIKTSPQIDHIQYKKDHFEIKTNDYYTFKFKIKKYTKN